MLTTKDKAGKEFWDGLWGKQQTLPRSFSPDGKGFRDHLDREWNRFFLEAFSGRQTHGKKLLEVGCGRSATLPYFAKQFGLHVTGVDYSEIGCEGARQILIRDGAEGEVICADFFSPPESLIGAFDFVVSFGVVEHFEDTSKCLESFSRFLKRGALIITMIPNLAGAMGSIQKRLDRSIYDKHVVLNLSDLESAHHVCGLRVLSCNFFIGIHLGVLAFQEMRNSARYWFLRSVRSLFSRALWSAHRLGFHLPPNQTTSPYIVCVAERI